LALGAQAGGERIGDVVGGGFGNFHRVAETSFNMVFEAGTEPVAAPPSQARRSRGGFGCH
jgi:hypothetical protein